MIFSPSTEFQRRTGSRVTRSPAPDPARIRRGPLADERVLDLSSTPAAAFCAKLLGDLGADVVKVEPPGDGDPSRGRTTAGSGEGLAASPEFLYLNTSKRSVALDLDSPAARPLLAELVRTHDIVVVDGPDGRWEQHGLSAATHAEAHPGAIVVAVSPFGGDGPYRDFAATPLIACALGGWMHTCGEQGRAPLQAGGDITDTVAGAYAAVAALAAVEARARDGVGDHVDVSALEAAITCAFFPSMLFEYHSEGIGRHSDYMTGPSFHVRCGDGWLGVNVLTEQQWETLCAFIGRPDMADDPRFATDYYGRLAYLPEIREAIETAFEGRTALETFHEAQLWRLPFGLVTAPRDALELEVHAARDYFETHDVDGVGEVRTPRVPFVMAATPSRPGPPPDLGADTEPVLRDLLGLTGTELDDLRSAGVIA
jgi:crotonobetainyl-CoA:carnitine CoA-transferase CaiB-like acyl-CoA transferase